MRSSVACLRCRLSKVKCVNTGPNTTCKACESSNRDCTYPQQMPTGRPRGSVAGAGMGVGSVAGTGAVGGADRIDTPKKSKSKKPAPNANAAATVAMNSPKAYKECLDSPGLTAATWKQSFDSFQLNHSPFLPFLHPPTFMKGLRASVPGAGATGSSPPAPENPHSPLLLLGMLALTSRHILSLVSRHAPALPTPVAVAEFYASALKYRLMHDEEEAGFLGPSLEKVQALVMLCVHEWGQNRKTEAYMWLGIAIRMTGVLGLALVDEEEAAPFGPRHGGGGSPESEADGPVNNNKRRKLDNGTSAKLYTTNIVEKEIRRRTFWSVFVLDKALSSGKYFPGSLSSADASRVLLPCEDRAFMFGTSMKTGYLRPDVGSSNKRNGESYDAGDEERILAKIVRAMDLWGRIQQWAEMPDAHPTNTNSTYHQLSTALETLVETLPQQLVFSLNTLQVHTSTQSSSPYVVLHTVLFLSRLTLEKKFLPPLPVLHLSPTGPDSPERQRTSEELSFYRASAYRFMSSARDLVTLMTGLKEWNAEFESPIIVQAVLMAAEAGIYAFSYPWMDPDGYLTGNTAASAIPAGTGEEANQAVAILAALKPRWPCAEDAMNVLLKLQAWTQEQEEQFIHESPHGREFIERSARAPVNTEEKNRLFQLLSPPTSKSSHTDVHVDTLLQAATGTSPDRVDRWIAVNMIPAPVSTTTAAATTTTTTATAAAASGQPKQEGLDTLAGMAAQHDKFGNGVASEQGGDVKMKEPGSISVKRVREDSQMSPQQHQPTEGRRGWVEDGVERNGQQPQKQQQTWRLSFGS